METHTSCYHIDYHSAGSPATQSSGTVTSGGRVAWGNYLQGYSIPGQKVGQTFPEGNLIDRQWQDVV